jgi:hypothetical protein
VKGTSNRLPAFAVPARASAGEKRITDSGSAVGSFSGVSICQPGGWLVLMLRRSRPYAADRLDDDHYPSYTMSVRQGRRADRCQVEGVAIHWCVGLPMSPRSSARVP